MDINFFKGGMSLADLRELHRDTAVERLGIRFTAMAPATLWAEMPVDERTVQPYGILHGGASLLLAESMGSVASGLVAGPLGGRPVGIEINGSHLRPAGPGHVTGVCRPLRVGRGLHFWRISVYSAAGEHCCESRLTIKILRSGSGAG
jgi:uncharacterized protein (TIGR00369 family)